METFSEIDKLTREFADARTVLADRIRIMNEKIDEVKRQKMAGIKSALARVGEKRAALKNAIIGAPECFVKPRTLVLHGVKVGFQKGPGKLTLAFSPEKTVEMIETKLADQADQLIEIVKKPIPSALKNLDAKELAKIGGSIEGSEDFVLIKEVAGDVDRLVSEILKSLEKEDLEEAA